MYWRFKCVLRFHMFPRNCIRIRNAQPWRYSKEWRKTANIKNAARSTRNKTNRIHLWMHRHMQVLVSQRAAQSALLFKHSLGSTYFHAKIEQCTSPYAMNRLFALVPRFVSFDFVCIAAHLISLSLAPSRSRIRRVCHLSFALVQLARLFAQLWPGHLNFK